MQIYILIDLQKQKKDIKNPLLINSCEVLLLNELLCETTIQKSANENHAESFSTIPNIILPVFDTI